ncbi:MAG: thioredoxin domain-containing protein [Ruminiclostridium sp.]|nr:thioredoxin domain-containing protein [Ruminiclostridium sp.]
MANHLQGQTSPYLRQHAHNPVDWYPWCQEAFEKAQKEDKPIFLSIGYSTCHWCHVMERESFEDQEVAELLNRDFVSIKVDREERPDIDSLYMAVCQAFTGNGGWPTTLFLTPDQRPFHAGTYFPKNSRGGLPGMLQLLPAVRHAWDHDRDKLLAQSREVLDLIQEEKAQTETPSHRDIRRKALDQWRASFDPVWGGFGSAPKFPMGHSLLALLTIGEKTNSKPATAMALKTLEQLYRGGIFDHIGGGFSRYSTDRQFLIPHFEKMLYDNALLILAYCKAWSVTKRELFREVARRTADYAIREMTLSSGVFVSAQDADSGGEEGSFYAIHPEEIIAVLGREKGTKFNQRYHITDQGNFMGGSIPNLLQAEDSADDCRDCLVPLRAWRRTRIPLHRDDKVITGWNGLMMAALAWLYRVTGRTDYLDTARKAWNALEKTNRQNGRLLSSTLDGAPGPKAFLEDYAFLSLGLLTLYEVTGERPLLEQAEELCRRVLDDFPDQSRGGFFLTSRDGEPLILRPKEAADGALPSGNTVMAWVLVRLAHLTGKEDWAQAAETQLDFLSRQAARYPTAYPVYLLAALEWEQPPEEVTVAAPNREGLPPQPWPFPLDAVVNLLDKPTEDHPLVNGQTTYYVCRDHTCQPPKNLYS